VSRVARATIPVLVVGETGTGKEVVARAIHDQSPRAERPMRCVNCAAIPANLLESILFGHEKGAFTGATRRTGGVFREAHGGTVFLDEIGELAAAAQAALLRVLETRRVTRVGSSEEDEVDVRVVAATHRDLEAMCEAGTFRLDLLYRINTMSLLIPPLRRRAEEIEQLAAFFLQEANEANGCQVQAIDSEAMDLMRSYHWPGNVRELRNVIHRAVVLARGEQLTADDLPDKLSALKQLAPRWTMARKLGQSPGADTPGPLPGDDGEEMDFKLCVQQFEEHLIRKALQLTAWRRAEAADLLNMPRRTLTHKLNVYGITPPDRDR
jgi:DNA-binding NtrC family response regulator